MEFLTFIPVAISDTNSTHFSATPEESRHYFWCCRNDGWYVYPKPWHVFMANFLLTFVGSVRNSSQKQQHTSVCINCVVCGGCCCLPHAFENKIDKSYVVFNILHFTSWMGCDIFGFGYPEQKKLLSKSHEKNLINCICSPLCCHGFG